MRGWGAGLADWYQRCADVFNRGFGGYTSRKNGTYIMKIFALIIFDYYYLDYGICASDHAMTPHLQLGIICFGENDAVDAGDVEERLHVSHSRYMWNMRSIIVAFREHNPDIGLIVITPPTVDSEQCPNRNSY